jgi:CheY-like chemotaxis protein
VNLQTLAQNIARSLAVSEAALRSFPEGRVLWVDDEPHNNVLLINAFQDLGIRVFLATSTDQALMLGSGPVKSDLAL